ncbi:two-component sensor histidine kinase [Saccharibacillus sp. O23]|uniref:HAMP domain-containing sensor histidine kinase n=1 Tax=Saccharibacillus sp. O23 TaxID=2009338 RepID=UPI000B4E2BE1|nr:HAMP domain-containing sensor histidine kinase [Saccharibacillus sp. O23]OWR27187.1 two-component sensor histidine kinase [Saccharibacillus sp. O23]
MIKSLFRLKLKVKLILALALTAVLSVGLFFALQTFGNDLLNRYFDRSSFIANQNAKTVKQFADYVQERHLETDDTQSLTDWVEKKKYVALYVYRDRKLVYSSDGYYAQAEGKDSQPFVPDESLRKIAFADADAQVYLESFSEYQYYTLVTFACLAVSLGFFLLLMLLFINVKTSYIEVLENEIKILEGGNLEYPITIKGKDELASLAQSINEMRKSFIERLASEEEARNANHELVTAMSHDLRTPLTALIGYLDIIQYRKYRTEEQLFKYIANSKDNAYRIKHLSDQLFEYFLMSHHSGEPLEFESYDGIPLLDQLIGTHAPLLIDEGLEVEWVPCETEFALHVHAMSMQRVFDNLFSNMLKYADKSEPATIRCERSENKLHLLIENRIAPQADSAESTGIGIKVCEKIIQAHGGTFSAEAIDGRYRVRIELDAAAPN